MATNGIKVARIVEFFYPEDELGKKHALELVEKCLVFFHEHQCDYVDFYCTSNSYINLLIEAGFTMEDSGLLPSLLDPIDMSVKFQNMELYISSEINQKYPDSKKSFFVTRADGDQDRPNQSYEKNILTA